MTTANYKLVAALLMLLTLPCHAAQWNAIEAVKDNIVCLRFDELVSIAWGKPGGTGYDDKLVTAPLDLHLAGTLGTYRLEGGRALKLGRKTRPHTFVRQPTGPAHALEHQIYLVLDQPLKPGDSLTISIDKDFVTSGPTSMTLTYDPAKSRSEAVQVNQLGYLPDAAKFAYVSAWLGDLGRQTFADGTAFEVLDASSRKALFAGKVKLRKPADQPDSANPNEGNYYRANLYECDFSPLTTPGSYVLSVHGVGCSYPFQIGGDVYRQAYITLLRGMYHQRCGTALTEPFTHWIRPICHTEPLRQTDHRYMDVPFSDGPVKDVPWKETGELRRNVAGGWHDAGDWDREGAHADIPSYLLLAYELTPDHYAPGELNIPESNNGLPDVINEARWGVDYYHRLQRPDGGVSVGMFESRWPLEGQTAATDTLIKYCYAEEPVCTFKQAAAAAHMALTLAKLGHEADAKIYTESAVQAWIWANDAKNLRPGDASKCRDDRLHAAAALYRLTGDTKYQDSFKRDLVIHAPSDLLFIWQKQEQTLGVWTYVLAPDDLPGLDKDLRAMLSKATLNYAKVKCVDTSAKRGNRRGYDWYYPFQWGHGVLVDNFPLMVAHKLSSDQQFLDIMVANCDLTLGNNPLNMTWVTGLGRRSPQQVMQINYWQDPQGPNPGIPPMGPSAYDPKATAKGPWEVGYAWQFVYPPAKAWPPLELWFEDRFCAQTNEFVVARQASVGAAFGYLCQPAIKARTAAPK